MSAKDVVLFVEDEPLVRDSIIPELEDAGFEVVAAESGDEASYILPKMRRIDLLLTDIRMPGRIDGWALAEIARCRRPNLPVIYASGLAPQRASEVEGSLFLAKPYRVGEILNAIEELKSGGEELAEINGEANSPNEELETSKEELKSLNEELRAANAKLRARVDELSRANSDLANLLASARIAAILLDPQLAIKRFTPAAKDLFHLAESDVGGPISHLSQRLRLDFVQEDAERVLRTLDAIERQTESDDGARRFVMRMSPYYSPENVIFGVVINFIDVTRITAAKAEIVALTCETRKRAESLERIVDLIPAGIFILGNDVAQPVQVNRCGARLIGDQTDRRGPRDAAVPFRLFSHGRELPFWEQPLQQAAYTGQAVPTIEGRLIRCDGSSAPVLMSAEPLLDEMGSPLGAIAAIIAKPDREEVEARQPSTLPSACLECRHVGQLLFCVAQRPFR